MAPYGDDFACQNFARTDSHMCQNFVRLPNFSTFVITLNRNQGEGGGVVAMSTKYLRTLGNVVGCYIPRVGGGCIHIPRG